MINKDLLKKLCLAFGPSGNECEVRNIIIDEIKNCADDYYTDKVGNLIAFKKGAKTPMKKRLFAAHMDEVGFMISSVDSDGYLRFKSLGGIESSVILGKQAIVGEKRFAAVFGGKPIHLLKSGEENKARPADSIYLDIGARKKDEKKEKDDDKEKNKKEVKEDKEDQKPVEVGEFAVFKSEFLELGQNKVKCKAIDDRFGCCILIEMLKSKLECDSYFAFTICEEIGLRGARTASNIVKADTAVIFEATTAGDIYDRKEKNKVCSLGNGAVISIMDNSTIYDRNLINLALDTAKSKNIKAQVKQAVAGGNDAGAVQRSGKGVEILAISLPTRYIHSPSCVADYGDMEECLRLALEMERIM
ncbi:MAG: M42 family peptidase [Oscillospiraceae bacterium]|nr:M42 family peptidase [Oscillospiraceae bacterium]